jgi:hypothetical protein
MNRTLLRAALCCVLLAGCGGSGEPADPTPRELQLGIQPGTLAARHNTSVSLRVDMASVGDSDLPTGYAIDLDEAAGHIDITTAPCQPGVGSRSCQDWTITPRDGALPGQYDVNVRSVGSRAGTATGAFRLVVVAEPTPAFGPAVRVASKSRNVVVLSESGRVFAQGRNTSGEVRIGYLRVPFPGAEPDVIVEPHAIEEFVETGLPAGRWVDVASGVANVFAVRDDGTVWAWGYNDENELGLPSARGDQLVLTPRQVPALTNVRAITVDFDNSRLIATVLLADGRVRRRFGLQTPVPYCEVAPRFSGDVECEMEFTGVQAIAGGAQDAIFLKQDGSVWRAPFRPCVQGSCPSDKDWFHSGVGRVERLNGALPRATAIASLPASGLALAADGTVWQWHRREATDSATQVGGLSDVVGITGGDLSPFAFALRRDGTVWTWNPDKAEAPRQISGLVNAVAIHDGHAITGDCGVTGGAVWRLDGQFATAERLDGFGAAGGTCGAAPTRTVSVALEGPGRVLSSPAGIDCPGACSARFPEGSRVILNEAPALGFTTVLRPARQAEIAAGVFSDQPDWRGDAGCGHLAFVGSDLSCSLRFVAGGDRRLSINVTGEGRVTSIPLGIDCGADCVQAFEVSTSVSLTATPALGYRFGEFTGDRDCADGLVTMDAVKDCIARFVALAAPATPTGFAAAASSDVVQLRWNAVNGPVALYRLERVDAAGVQVTIQNAIDGTAPSFIDGGVRPNSAYTYRLIAINDSGESAPAIVSTITPAPTRAQLSVTVTGTGTVTSTPAGIECTSSGGTCSANFASNTQVQLSATPGAGYRLAAFGGDPDCTDGVVTLAATLACSANFAQVSGQGWVSLGGTRLTLSGVLPSASLAIGSGNVPHIAYVEAVPAGDVARLRVKRFDGAAWQPLGDALNAGAITAASEPSLAFALDGALHVAWSQGNGLQQGIFVARYNGSTWESVGAAGVPLNYNTGARAVGPSLAFDGSGLPLVAWIEAGAVKFKRWTGVAWVPAQGAGSAEGPASGSADRVRLVTYADGVPVLAWTEGAGAARAIKVVRDFVFAQLGTQVNAPLNVSINHFGVLADRNGPQVPGPTVTWAQGSAPFSILARRWDGSAWIDNGSPVLDNDPGLVLSFAMARNSATIVRTSTPLTGDASSLQVNQRFNLVAWDPLGPSLDGPRSAGLRNVALETTTSGLPIVAGSRLDASERFELVVYGYFP